MSDAVTEKEIERPWQELSGHVEAANSEGVAEFFDGLPAEEMRFAMSHLSGEEQAGAVSLMAPADAASLLEHLPEVQSADILEEIAPELAADILEILPDELGADFIRDMPDAEGEAILAEIDDLEEAEHIREKSNYDWDTAGGLMSDAYASFPDSSTVGDVLRNLGENAERYGDMDVQYVYVTNPEGHLTGVLRLRDLVLTPREQPVINVMITETCHGYRDGRI